MAIQGSLSKLRQAQPSDEENIYSDFFSGFSERRKKQGLEEQKQQKINEANRIAEESNAEVSKNQADKKSLFTKVKQYGPGATVDTAKNVGGGFIQGPKILAQGTARALGAGNETPGQIAATNSLDATQQRILETLRDPSIPQARKDILLGALNSQNRESVLQATENTKTVESQTNARKFAAASAELALTAAGGSTLRAAKGLGTAGRAAVAGAEGGTFGALGALEQEKATLPSVIGGAALGTTLGALLPVLGARAKGSKVVDDILPSKVGQSSDIITNPSRLLAANAGESAGTSSKFIQRIEQDPRAAVVSRGASLEDVNALNALDKRLMTAQRTGNITAPEARTLLQQRQALVERIQNPKTEAGIAIRDIDEKLTQATDPKQIDLLTKEKAFAQKQAILDAHTQSQLIPGERKVAGLSKNTEARAIDEGLTGGIDDLATYNATPYTDQGVKVSAHMDADYEAAKRIAMGTQAPPEGMLANAYYRGVEARARTAGDFETIRQLAQSEAGTRTSKAAQELGVLGLRDPESPVVAMEDILKARKNSALDIPQAVTTQEAERITTLAQDVEKAKSTLVNGGDRDAYGVARVTYDNYVNELKAAASKTTLKEAIKNPGKTTGDIAGALKSIKAGLFDNSIIGRQGWKVLFSKPGVWAKNSKKSFGDYVHAFGGKEVLDAVNADVVSRDLALNGTYKKLGLDVYGVKDVIEEAFPNKAVGKIPLIGRFQKGADSAFTGWQQRTRADLADLFWPAFSKTAEASDPNKVKSLGNLINSMTSRGSLGKYEAAGDVLNKTFFSPRNTISNFNFLGGHIISGGGGLHPLTKGSNFVRKQAAQNLLKTAVGSAAILKIASELKPGSVTTDTRSADFGKIKIGNTRFDVSGGMSQLPILGNRILSKQYKSSSTGETTNLNEQGYNKKTVGDLLNDFFSNKLSPVGSVINESFLKGETFDKEKPTVANQTKSLLLPLAITNFQELKNTKGSANIVASMIAEGLGISTNTYSPKSNWNASDSKELKAFKSNVGDGKFKEANNKFNDEFNQWFDDVRGSDTYTKLSPEARMSLLTKKRSALQDDVFQQYNFKYVTPKKDTTESNLQKELLKYRK